MPLDRILADVSFRHEGGLVDDFLVVLFGKETNLCETGNITSNIKD